MRARLHEWLTRTIGADAAAWLVPDQLALVALGFLLAAVAAVWLARRDGLQLRGVALGLMTAFACAIIGARFVGALLQPGHWLQNPLALVDLRRAPSSSIGALLGGCIGYLVYAWRTGRNPWRDADAVVPAAGLGLALARLGCFVNGCDYGRVTTWPWGTRYPADSAPWVAQLEHGFIGSHQSLSHPVHPFPLVLGGFDLAIFVLFACWPSLGRRGRDTDGPEGASARFGDRALLAAAIYFTGRFFIEFLRSPWSSPQVGALSVAQWLCVAALLVIYGLYSARR